jgi:prephenate dehydratase
MRIGYLGPAGTFTEEALRGSWPNSDFDPVPLPTVYDTVMAVHEREVDRALVPIENSLEGSVNATLDALAVETEDVAIVGETVHQIRHCLIARTRLELEAITTVLSIPQASAQCARFIRTQLPNATVMPANSTADAVRIVSETEEPWAAVGNRVAAEIYGCEILHGDIEDAAGNETRFVWLAPKGTEIEGHGPWKTSVVFWGAGDNAPGWLVRCLSEFAFRGVNLTLIESRPRKQGLGHYMFFADLEGRDSDPQIAAALEAIAAQTEALRVLGSYPAA